MAGQEIGERTIREISKEISDSIEPKIFPRISAESLGGKTCIVVRFEGLDRPYFAYGRAYIRVGDENKKVSARELERLILEKNKILWEERISDNALNGVNENALRNFVKKANDAKRINFRFNGVRSTLNKLHLLKGGWLLKATEMLFCDSNPLEIQAAVFAGRDKLTFLDIRQLKGNVFSLLEQSETYIKEHMDWRARLEGRERKEIPEVPLRAITEALVNSLCHRDYSDPKGNEIAIFRDRIEIYNPGQFPEDYSPGDFIKGRERSILRNPLIANTLYLSKDIERWGSGIRRIWEACREEKVGVRFKRLKSGFLVIFKRRRPGGGTTLKTTPKTTLKTDERILLLVRENRSITKEELASRLGITLDGVKYHVKKLRKHGLLLWKGSSKGGHWEATGA